MLLKFYLSLVDQSKQNLLSIHILIFFREFSVLDVAQSLQKLA